MARNPRILMVTPRFPPDVGGIETHVAEVAPRLARAGFDVTVLTTDRSGTLPEAENLDGVRVRRVRAYPEGRDYYLAPGLPAAMESAAPDLVHVQGWHTLVPPLAMAAAVRLGVPYVVTFHSGGSSVGWRRWIRGAQRLALRPAFMGASALVAVSRYELELFRRQLRLSRDRFVLLRNGSSLPAPHVPAGRRAPVVVSVGRLERYKGHGRLVEAWPHVLRSVPDARLRILGTGPEEGALRDAITANHLEASVDLTSVAPDDRQAMADELGSAALFALVSDFEAHPVSVMEALSVGTPVLVAMTSGLTELVEDGLALGVHANASAREIAAPIVEALERGPGRVHFDLPTWDDSAGALGDLYRRVLRERGSRQA